MVDFFLYVERELELKDYILNWNFIYFIKGN